MPVEQRPLISVRRGRAALLCLGLLTATARAASGDFEACLTQLRGEALAKGVSTQVFDTATAGVQPDQSVLDAMSNQPEFQTPIWDYLATLVDDQRIADGQAKLAEWSSVLNRAEQVFGVDRYTIVAIWGIESDFGKVIGARPLVRSLTTLSCFGGRQRFFRGELSATLRILQSGDIAPEALVGSWAGAFGQTQFMPTTFQRLAVDFDGDGRRDIVASVADALASAANFLKRAGWVSGEPWGYEVRVPPGYSGPSGRRDRQPIAEWARRGIRRTEGGPLTGSAPAALLFPAGEHGPAFIVFRNFEAIYSYNAAQSYALAIAHLSDRLRGLGPFQTAWPTDDPGISRAQRRELQELLIGRGYDIGTADGLIGPRTRAAISSFQASIGLAANGRAGAQVLDALKRAPIAAPRPEVSDAPARPPADGSKSTSESERISPRPLP